MNTTYSILATAAVLLASTAVSGASEKKDEISAQTEKALKDKEICIVVDTVIPAGGPSIDTVDGYTLTIKDGTVNAELPFIGTCDATLIPGVDETGIKFEDRSIKLEEKKGKGRYVWTFSAKSDKDDIDVTITFWNDGSAEIYCNCLSRSSMTYRGILK